MKNHLHFSSVLASDTIMALNPEERSNVKWDEMKSNFGTYSHRQITVATVERSSATTVGRYERNPRIASRGIG
jgi:hypothetical protein